MTLTGSQLVGTLRTLASTPSPEADHFTELDHALQCAYELSLSHPGDEELQIAGLLHDIGHQFGSDAEHGERGGRAVRPVLGNRVAGLIEAHVVAKRYLVTTDPTYGSRLTAVSTDTLRRQGGALDDGGVAAFRDSPLADDALSLRRADDRAKVAGRSVPSLDHWMPLLLRLVEDRALA